MAIQKLDLKGFFFILALILLAYLMFQMFSPFLAVIVLGLVVVELMHPLYAKLASVLNNKGLASIIATFITILVIVVPVVLISLLILSEISKITETRNIPEWLALSEQYIRSIVTSINAFLSSLGIPAQNQIASPDLYAVTNLALTTVKSSLLPVTTSIISLSLNTLFYLFLLIITLLYLFIEYDNLPSFFSRISPLDDKLDEMLLRKFKETVRAVIKGNFVVAIAQATSVSLMMIVMNIGASVLLWLIMVVLSLVPVGSGLVWAPAGLILILIGRPVEGIVLIVYSAIVINVIDTLLRPMLIKGALQLHPLVIIFSVLGGIYVFNSPLGILYGPIVAVFFTSVMHIYNEHFADRAIVDGNET